MNKCKDKYYKLQAIYTFQIIQNQQSHIFIRNRVYDCLYDENYCILFDGKDNEVIISKNMINEYFNIIG